MVAMLIGLRLTVFRAINKARRVCGDGMSPKVLCDLVRAAAARAGIDKLAPARLATREATSSPRDSSSSAA
jgi:hypothetical protein